MHPRYRREDYLRPEYPATLVRRIDQGMDWTWYKKWTGDAPSHRDIIRA
jgi:hypothetical protein